jgi:AbrB family looped-hinge helix DNA binding protein
MHFLWVMVFLVDMSYDSSMVVKSKKSSSLDAVPRTLVTKVTRGGQISLPVEAREVLGVKPGDKVYVMIENGEVKVVKPKYTLNEVLGKLPHPRPGVSVEQMIQDGMEDWAKEEVHKMQTGRG